MSDAGSDRVQVAQITITRYFDPSAEGGYSVYTEYSDGLTLYDALALLAYSTHTTPATYENDE